MSATVTINFTVGVDYQLGDYVKLCGNGGCGNIDWDNPLTDEIYDLFPNGAGIYGFGYAPWGNFRWGQCHSVRTAGWGNLLWGNFPWGHGTTIIEASYSIDDCGDYKFAFTCYDQLGNLHQGSPEETTLYIHIAPAAPTPLAKNSYNKTTDILILDVAA